jgi:hypothetical protein
MKEEIKKENPDIFESDLEAESLAAVQNATAAMKTQENITPPPNDVDTKLSESEQSQFNNEFSNSQPASPEPPAPQPDGSRQP